MFVAPETTTPTEARHHGQGEPRGLETTPASSTRDGRYGRMFRHVPVYQQSRVTLEALGQAIDAGEEIAAIEVGATRGLTTPFDLVEHNFPYLRSL